MKRAEGAWVITGAASGFGAEFARRLRERGERLVLWDRAEVPLKKIGRELGAHVEIVDVVDPAAVAEAVQRSADAAGPLAHVVSCAGILRVGPAATMPADDLRAMMDVNFHGTVNVVTALLPSLEAAASADRPATILFVSSVAGLRGFPDLAGYSASKFAVLGYAQALRGELRGRPFDVRVLCPPPGDTPMVRALDEVPPVYRLSRLYSAAEVVDAALAGLEGHAFKIFVDAGSKILHRIDRVAPAVVDGIVALSPHLPSKRG
ncbi:MAG: SDR family NAD(P)-dependent oxidoreductase [Myxococcales bacterium]|nr:SDR family NAD(P)-dependent oxidoreductase [Myxococcales bacterium]